MTLIDQALGIRRCGGSLTLYLRFLSRFEDDPSLQRMKCALHAGDVQAAFLHAHTLKGLAAQLGLCAVHAHASALCDALRPPAATIPPQAHALFPPLAAACRDTAKAIRMLTQARPG